MGMNQQSPQPKITLPVTASREFWLKERQAVLIRLAALDELLGLSRTVPPKQHDKRK